MAAYDEDFLLALQLQDQLNQIENNRNGGSTDSELHKSAEKKYTSDVMSVIDPRWEMIDPSPDARAMFLEFNDKYFSGNLAGVEVRWSPRMTLCAGVCCYEGRGGLCSIRLSEPLLKLRPRKDLVETLLHEMIHAFLFVTQNNKDRDGHGPEFCKHMDRINDSSGSHITIYHSFHDEVENYRKHWWKCDGPCQQRRPYYGYVKRAMNRAPSPRDPWWPDHQRTCGGTYHKVKEPEGYGVKKSSKKQSNEKPPVKTNKPSSQDIRGLFNKHDSNHNNSAAATAVSSDNPSHKESDLPMLPKLPSVDSGANIRGFDGVVEGRSVSVFTGAGQSLGGQGTSSRTNVIVRRIPGVGVIETRVGVALTGGAMSNNTATDETDDASTLTQIGNNTAASSNNLSRQDNKGGADHSSSSSASNKHGGENVSRSKRKHSDSECETNRIPNKRAKQLSVRDLFSAQGASQPVGTQVTIPGFTSVSNKQAAKDRVGSREADRDNCAKDRVGSRAADRDNCAKERGGSWAADRDNRAKERGGSRAADRDNRAKERGGSWAADRNNRAHHLSNSESDDEEKQPLSSVLHTSQTSTVGGRPKSQTSTDRGQPKSQTSTDWGQPNSQTSTERGQPKSQTSNERGQPKSQTSTDRGQPKSQTDGGQPLAAGSNGHQNDATLVACPVCLASMPQAEINAHLDSCLS